MKALELAVLKMIVGVISRLRSKPQLTGEQTAQACANACLQQLDYNSWSGQLGCGVLASCMNRANKARLIGYALGIILVALIAAWMSRCTL
jgi:hypothetical protein